MHFRGKWNEGGHFLISPIFLYKFKTHVSGIALTNTVLAPIEPPGGQAEVGGGFIILEMQKKIWNKHDKEENITES